MSKAPKLRPSPRPRKRTAKIWREIREAMKEDEGPPYVPSAAIAAFGEQLANGRPIFFPEVLDFLKAYLETSPEARGGLQKLVTAKMLEGGIVDRYTKSATNLPELLHQISKGRLPPSRSKVHELVRYVRVQPDRLAGERARIDPADAAALQQNAQRAKKVTTRLGELESLLRLLDAADGLAPFGEVLATRRAGGKLDLFESIQLVDRYGHQELGTQRTLRRGLKDASLLGGDSTAKKVGTFRNPKPKDIVRLGGLPLKKGEPPDLRLKGAMDRAERVVTNEDRGAGIELGVAAGGMVVPVGGEMTGGVFKHPVRDGARETDRFFTGTLETWAGGARPIWSKNHGFKIETIVKTPLGVQLGNNDPLAPGKIGFSIGFAAIRATNNGNIQLSVEPPLFGLDAWPLVRSFIGVSVETPGLAGPSEWVMSSLGALDGVLHKRVVVPGKKVYHRLKPPDDASAAS